MKLVRKACLLFCSIAMLFTMTGISVCAEGGYTMEPPLHHKRIADNGDGTYTLSLDVTGRVENEDATTPVDVLVILDVSGSMRYSVGGGSSKSRLAKMQELISHLSGELLYTGSTHRMALIQFSGNNGWGEAQYDDGRVLTQWTSSSAQIKGAVNGIRADGGTNWQAGFYEATHNLDSFRGNAAKYVIFVSDGNPNFYYGSSGIDGQSGEGWTKGSGSGYDATAYAKAKEEAQSVLSGATFFSVGVGGSADRMKNFAQELGGKYYDGTDANALDKAFGEIQTIIQHSYKNVVVTDTLSEYVDILDENNLSVTAVDSDGNSVELPEGMNVSYSEDTRTVTMCFPEEYTLGHGITYTVSFKVQPSIIAESEYALDGKYPHTGDPDTGDTSAGKEGFYSNTKALLEYNGTSVEYPYPVVQVTKEVIRSMPLAGGRGNMLCLILGFGLFFAAGIRLLNYKRGV